MKAILYARFSPRPNAADCESCESQLSDLRAYCTSHDYEVVGEYHDDAVSGGDDWTDRPGMFEAATACKRGMVFLIRSFDRLFRDAAKGMIFAALIERKGCRVASISEEGANDNSPTGKLMRGILLLMAEFEKAMIIARTRAAMRRHQANGRRMSNHVPWGTQRDPANPKRLIPCQEELAIVERIKELRDHGMGLRQIGRWLTEHGAQRRGKPDWPHEIIRRILSREEESVSS